MAQTIQRIEKEFVLKYLVDNKISIDIRLLTQHFTGVLSSFNSDNLFVTLHDNSDMGNVSKNHAVNVFFHFQKIPITFKSSYVSSEDKIHIFSSPVIMYKDLTRVHERIEADDRISLSIIIEGLKMNIDFPTSASYFDPELLTREHNFADRKMSDLKMGDLIKNFRAHFASFSSTARINIFRNRKFANIIEQLIAISGKVIALPLSDLKQFTEMEQKIPFLKAHDTKWVAIEIGEDYAKLNKDFQNHITTMGRRMYRHELYVPILYYEYVVGYVYLMRRETEGFSKKQVELSYQFCRLLAYSMQTKGYFKKKLVREKITNCELIDISASGLAFSYPQNVPTPPPQLYSELDLILEIDNNPIPIKGRIVRKFNYVNRIYFGIQFVDLSDIVKDRISRELYGDNYDSEVEIR